MFFGHWTQFKMYITISEQWQNVLLSFGRDKPLSWLCCKINFLRDFHAISHFGRLVWKFKSLKKKKKTTEHRVVLRTTRLNPSQSLNSLTSWEIIHYLISKRRFLCRAPVFPAQSAAKTVAPEVSRCIINDKNQL